MRVGKNLQLELSDTYTQMEEVSTVRDPTEGCFLEQVRENGQLSAQVEDQEEELGQLVKQYRASAGKVATYLITLQEQAVRIQSLEMERNTAKEEAFVPRARIGVLEECARESTHMRDWERREEELLRRLEIEEANIGRAETQVIRLLGDLEKGEKTRVYEENYRCRRKTS